MADVWPPPIAVAPSPSCCRCPCCGTEDFPYCLFLFCCSEPTRALQTRLSFRTQLPRNNEFYSFEPPSKNCPHDLGESVCLHLQPGTHPCRMCGCFITKTCSRRHQAHYCSKEQQIIDWRLVHKQTCTQIFWIIQFQTTTCFFQNLKL